jgi:phosphatidate cytidylyltransferase
MLTLSNSNVFLSNFVVRVLSAVVLIGVLLGLYKAFGRQGLLGLGILMVSLGLYEFATLMFGHLESPARNATKTIFLITQWACLFCTLVPRLLFSAVPIALFIVGFSLAFWNLQKRLPIERLYQTTTAFFLGFLYLPVLSSTALGLLHSPAGETYFWFLIVTVIATDSAAYLAGKSLGKSKLAPEISPKKSWAGFWGGLLGGAIVGILFARLHPQLLTFGQAILISVSGSLASQTGDLFESLMKRHLQVKDSSNLIPGHGGVLDRLDGILFAAPIFAAAYVL